MSSHTTPTCPFPQCLQQRSLPASCLTLHRTQDKQPADLPCIAMLVGQLLLQHNRLSVSLFDGDLIKAYLVTEVGSHHPFAQRAHHHLGREFPFCNVHSLAIATGLARETVRRKVKQLVEENWLQRLPDGGLLVHPARVRAYQQEILPQQLDMLLQNTDKIRALLASSAPSASG